jgi:hypothetical protein
VKGSKHLKNAYHAPPFSQDLEFDEERAQVLVDLSSLEHWFGYIQDHPRK